MARKGFVAKSGPGTGFTPIKKAKAINPIEKERYNTDDIELKQLKQDEKRKFKWGPRGKFVPKSGTNESFQ